MPIKSLELRNVGPFRRRPDGAGADGIEMEFDAKVNLLIGPNNVGKSTILRVIKLLTTNNNGLNTGELRQSDTPPGYLAVEWLNEQGAFRSVELPAVYLSSDYYHHLNEGDRLTLGFGNIAGVNVDLDQWDGLMVEHGYVAYQGTAFFPEIRPGTETYLVPISSDGDSLSTIHSSVANIHDGIEYDVEKIFEAYGEELPEYNADEVEWTIPILVQLQTSGFPEHHKVFREITHVMSHIIEGFDIEIATGIFDYRHGEIGYISRTSDGEVKMHELSQGTRSVVGWMVRFLAGMALYYRCESNWMEKPGIFIIDEIDAHLHPSWQRRIIPTLQRHFPNVQIFASTHSPMMVAGLKAGQVHLLKRDGTGQVVWSRNEQDIIGWTADEIYRTFMGIDDPTDELTVQRANRLRELRDKDDRTKAEEDEMNALRRQVNEDLLAGGRLNAQRERYASLMEQFLRSRMADLSQDGA